MRIGKRGNMKFKLLKELKEEEFKKGYL